MYKLFALVLLITFVVTVCGMPPREDLSEEDLNEEEYIPPLEQFLNNYLGAFANCPYGYQRNDAGVCQEIAYFE